MIFGSSPIQQRSSPGVMVMVQMSIQYIGIRFPVPAYLYISVILFLFVSDAMCFFSVRNILLRFKLIILS